MIFPFLFEKLPVCFLIGTVNCKKCKYLPQAKEGVQGGSVGIFYFYFLFSFFLFFKYLKNFLCLSLFFERQRCTTSGSQILRCCTSGCCDTNTRKSGRFLRLIFSINNLASIHHPHQTATRISQASFFFFFSLHWCSFRIFIYLLVIYFCL